MATPSTNSMFMTMRRKYVQANVSTQPSILQASTKYINLALVFGLCETNLFIFFFAFFTVFEQVGRISGRFFFLLKPKFGQLSIADLCRLMKLMTQRPPPETLQLPP